MKAFTNGAVPVVQGFHKSLGDVIRVDMVYGFHPDIRQGQYLTPGKYSEHLGIEMPGRIQWDPSRTNDMSGMQYRCWKTVLACFFEQVSLDRSFIDPIFPEGIPGMGIISRNLFEIVPQCKKCCTCPRSALTNDFALSGLKQIISMTLSGARSWIWSPKTPFSSASTRSIANWVTESQAVLD
jgi:hypothetical protein